MTSACRQHVHRVGDAWREWVVSPAGVSYACKCGWRSGVCVDQKSAAERMWQHVAEAYPPVGEQP